MNVYSEVERAFLAEHTWGTLATSRRDGSPQQAVVGYGLDGEGRLVVSTRVTSAKWHNAARQPKVAMTVAEGKVSVVVYGTAELFDTDPERAELSADALAAVLGQGRPDPASIAAWLDQDERGVIRITPERVLLHE